jgi:hypothetical protein
MDSQQPEMNARSLKKGPRSITKLTQTFLMSRKWFPFANFRTSHKIMTQMNKPQRQLILITPLTNAAFPYAYAVGYINAMEET